MKPKLSNVNLILGAIILVLSGLGFNTSNAEQVVDLPQGCGQNAVGCDEVDCGLRFLALRLGSKILPSCVRGNKNACDNEISRMEIALGTERRCRSNFTNSPKNLGSQPNNIQAPGSIDTGARTIFVSPSGDNALSGSTRSLAVRTIQVALTRTRNMNGSGRKLIVLTSGKHRITNTINLGPGDSFTTFQGESGATVTGAIDIGVLQWIPTADKGVFSASIPPEILSQLGPLSVLSWADSQNIAIRAQHPNKNSFLQQTFMSRNYASKWFDRPRSSPYTSFIKVPVTNLLDRFNTFNYVSNGSCLGQFDPPTGYFCNPKADADGGCEYNIPGGVSIRNSAARGFKMDRWRNRSTGYLHSLHPLRWGGWGFQIGENCPGVPAKWDTLCLAKGGFQEARGDCSKGGGDFFIENIRELLDSPNEFFLDLSQSRLYFYPPQGLDLNATRFEIGSDVQTLISTRGASADKPAESLNFFNIAFERTYPTHMESHEVPSGGDWSVHRGGALFLENVLDVAVTDCSFRFLGSNGVFISKFARQVDILRNNLYALDGSGILMVGDPKYTSDRPWDRTKDRDWVANVRIRNNLISDLGLRELQGAGIFGSIAMDVVVENNVVFNGPRAGIIYNDLFGGLLQTTGNILFNMVQVTHDHGPYNVWDRQKWLLPDGYFQNKNIVLGNFIMGNALGPKLVDLDDGARNHVVSNNVLAFGNMKFKGSNHTATGNAVIAYLPQQPACVDISKGDKSRPQFVWNDNTCYSRNRKTQPYRFIGNTLCNVGEFAAARNAYLGFSSIGKVSSCGSLRTWLTGRGQDSATVFSKQGSLSSTIITRSEDLLSKYF